MLLAAVAHPATEQTAVAGKRNGAHVSGTVTDARTGTGLAYATLAVKGTTVGIAADASGRFTLNNLPTGRLTLIAAAVGYKSAEQELRLEAGETVRADFALEEEALTVEEIVVSASRTETNKKYSPTIVSVASGKLFEATASCNLAETMNFQSGLRVENNCGNCGTTQLRINGLEGQYSQVLLDSRPIFSSLAAMYGLEQLPVSMIERVEVIRGGGSALFGANAIGGVVNIITKEPQRNSLALSNTTNCSRAARPTSTRRSTGRSSRTTTARGFTSSAWSATGTPTTATATDSRTSRHSTPKRRDSAPTTNYRPTCV